MTEVRLEGVSKRFGRHTVLDGVDLTVADGEFCVFVGPSGCGKSTLLRIIAGLDEVTAGEILIGGQRVTQLPPARRDIAMVFQSYALYPHMNVYQNMAFGLTLAKTGGENIDVRVRRVAETLHITPFLDRRPRELSGGQRQRVAIGRAIVRKPGVFLFDEPLSNLDAALRVRTRLEIAKLHAKISASMIYVTHDQVEAMTLADRIVLLHAGAAVGSEGSVAQIGTPTDLYHHPASLFVAGFIGSPRMNTMIGRIVGASQHRAEIELPGGVRAAARVAAPLAVPGDKVTLGIRPEHVRVKPAGSGRGLLTMEASHVEHAGESSYLYLGSDALRCSSEDTLLTVREDGDTATARGDLLAVDLPEEHCHLFDEHGRAFLRTVSHLQSGRDCLTSRPFSEEKERMKL